MRMSLSRRAFLRGMGGVGVALPALEIMNRGVLGGGVARAASAIPKRYVVAFCGTSMGAYSGNLVAPKTTGTGYTATAPLAPLQQLGVLGDVSVVSDLVVPWETNGVIPAGGRTAYFHGYSVLPQLTGTRQLYNDGPLVGRSPSSDQIVAQLLSPGTAVPSLQYRVEADTWGFGWAGHMSYQRNSSGGMSHLTPTESPRLAYEALFTGFTPGSTDNAATLKAQQLLRRRKSVVDLVKTDAQSLLPKLGAWDKARMTQHFDEIRALESKLAQVAPPPPSNACTVPARPVDPMKADPLYSNSSMNYSGEKERASMFVDLLHMAFVCDRSRVASLQFNPWKSYLNLKPITGYDSDVHGLTHGNGGDDDLCDSLAWHIGHWGSLIAKLKASSDGAGGNLLDHSALSMVFEGGHGYDPEGVRDDSAHSTEGMVVLVGGHAGGLKGGKHIVTGRKHPAMALISAMNAVGVTGNTLGEVTGTIPELFT